MSMSALESAPRDDAVMTRTPTELRASLNHAGSRDAPRYRTFINRGCWLTRSRSTERFALTHSAHESSRRDDAVMTRALLCTRTTAVVFAPAVALSFVEGDVLRYLAIILAAASVLLLTTTARGATAGVPQPALIARISKQVFGPRWTTAACIAHYESTDGAHLVNGPNLGPWQVNVAAHRWVNARRLLTDWWYSARVAYRISNGGRDWSAWSTRGLCGA